MQQNLRTAWLDNQSKLVGLNQRLSPLNVLGVATLETVAREWVHLDAEARRKKTRRYVQELEADSLSPLREATALLQNSELRKAYGFDLYYDIARAYALKTSILHNVSSERAAVEFAQVKTNLATAKENAKTSQLEAAVSDLTKEITFVMLTPEELVSLRQVLSVGVTPMQSDR